MTLSKLLKSVVSLGTLLILAFLPSGSLHAKPVLLERHLSADHIIGQALKRTKQTQRRTAVYRYSRLTVTEELDASGNIRERREKLYDVSSIGELPNLKVVKINGQPIPSAKLKEEQARESRVRQKLVAKKGAARDMTEICLTPELVSKYQFTLEAPALVNGRPSFVLAFAPKAGQLPVNEFADRLLNHLSGKLWIDQAEFEIAKAEISLQTEVKLWGGLLASLREVSLSLTRSRVEPGVWFNNLATGQFEGRKLLASTRVRTESTTSNFTRVGSNRG